MGWLLLKKGNCLAVQTYCTGNQVGKIHEILGKLKRSVKSPSGILPLNSKCIVPSLNLSILSTHANFNRTIAKPE
jgi:hypothetical protein